MILLQKKIKNSTLSIKNIVHRSDFNGLIIPAIKSGGFFAICTGTNILSTKKFSDFFFHLFNLYIIIYRGIKIKNIT